MNRIIHRFVLGAAGVVLAANALAQASTAAGEVAKIDKAASRVTLKHSGIKNLDMPPMSMIFRVRDPKMLDGVAVGDRVRFVAERVDGQYTLTALSKAP
jgi:Cu(I)/Ag(I) efflux system periplasmic protein CusF